MVFFFFFFPVTELAREASADALELGSPSFSSFQLAKIRSLASLYLASRCSLVCVALSLAVEESAGEAIPSPCSLPSDVTFEDGIVEFVFVANSPS